MTNTQSPVIKARLSIQRALLGMVAANLRAVAFSINDEALDIRCYFEGVVGEEEKETMSCVETEILADYESEFSVEVHVLPLDPFEPIIDDGVWVYHRKESLAD
jgi:hypothetical protein